MIRVGMKLLKAAKGGQWTIERGARDVDERWKTALLAEKLGKGVG